MKTLIARDQSYIAEKLSPLDRDGMAIMANPPPTFPAFLVLRLCDVGYLIDSVDRNYLRPPLVRLRNGKFVLTHLGRKISARLRSMA